MKNNLSQTSKPIIKNNPSQTPKSLGKKGQAWSLDLVIASIIFTIGIVILYVYAINYVPSTENKLSDLIYESNFASELILSEDEHGILTQGKIDQTKLNNFNDLDYDSKREILGLINNFYFTIPNMEINGTPAKYVGKINTSEINDLAKVTRLTIYKNKPTKFELYTWQ